MRAESIRLICPAPTPRVWLLPQNTIALDFTYLATRQANIRSSSCCGVGARLVATLSSSRRSSRLSEVCISMPEPTRFTSIALRPRAQSVAPFGSTPASEISSTRTFGLARNTSSASGEYAGAIRTSTNCLATCAAAAPSSVWLNAMMPPKADVGSVAKALA